MGFACHSCGAEVPDPRAVYRTTVCTGCGRDLRICLNCRFHSPGAHYDCSETVDEPVADKERANFCAYFVFRSTGGAGGSKPEAGRKARQALDKLFGDG